MHGRKQTSPVTTIHKNGLRT